MAAALFRSIGRMPACTPPKFGIVLPLFPAAFSPEIIQKSTSGPVRITAAFHFSSFLSFSPSLFFLSRK